MLWVLETIIYALMRVFGIFVSVVQVTFQNSIRAIIPGQISGRVAVGLSLVAFWVFTVHIWPAIFILSSDGQALANDLEEADRIHLTPEIYDANGEFLAAINFAKYAGGKSIDDSQKRFGRVQKSKDKADVTAAKISSTVFVEEPNQDYVNCLRRLEDRYDGHPLVNPYGNDLFFPPRLFKNMIVNQKTMGGSTLVAQYQQQVGFPRRDSRFTTTGRKLREIYLRTPAMSAVVGYTKRSSDQFAARVMPHASGAGGGRGEVRGLAMGARVMFGVDQAQLRRAHAYFLAGAVQTLPPLAYTNKGDRKSFRVESDATNKGNILAKARQGAWNTATGQARAMVCVRELAPPSEHEALSKELKAIAEGNKEAATGALLDQIALQAFAKAKNPTGSWRYALQNPTGRGALLIPDVVGGLARELNEAFGNRWNGAVSRIILATPFEPQFQFHRSFDQGARSFLRKADADGWLNPVYRGWAQGGACNDEGCPNIVAAIADADGRIVRFFSSKETASLYYGSDTSRYSSGGPLDRSRYRYDKEGLQVASIGKVGAALLFARMNVDINEVRDMMARSSTTRVQGRLDRALKATREKARREGKPVPTDTDDVARLLHWSSESAINQSGGVENAAVAYSKGTYAASPRTIHHNMSVLLNGFSGRNVPVRPPTLVKEVRYLDYYNRRLASTFPRLPDYLADDYQIDEMTRNQNYLGALRDATRGRKVVNDIKAAIESPNSASYPDTLLPPEDRQAVYTMLRAPFCDRGGTMFDVGRGGGWCARLALLFGKTGTHDITGEHYAVLAKLRARVPYRARDGVINSLWTAGGVKRLDGSAFSFVLIVSSGGSQGEPLFIPSRPGISDRNSRRLAPLVEMLLSEISGEKAN